MDQYDIFKKISRGATFDFHKFRNDAIKFFPQSKFKEKSTFHVEEEEVKEVKKEINHVDESEDEFIIFEKIKSRKKKNRSEEKTPAKLKLIHDENVNRIRNVNHIHVKGSDISDPIETFDQLQLRYKMHSSVFENIKAMNYLIPTAIQMQAIPVMLERREILAAAPTGSGKTIAFLVPVLHQLREPRNEGIRALIVVPTRELANQIFRETNKLAAGRGFRIVVIDDVKNIKKKYEKSGGKKIDILITTPNRLIYLLQEDKPLLSLKSVEWLIIDESDKLFEEGKKGFREQLGIIYKACDSAVTRRAMFSATFSNDVIKWCRLNLDNLVTISIGQRNTAVDSVDQSLLFVGTESGKLLALRNIISQGITPPVLVFVQSKERAKELFNELIYDGINVEVIHSDKTQLQRDNIVTAFRTGGIWVLICTELMGRGIDFKGINLVINYDFPPSTVSYIHRIGRTGRAGRRGQAITFFTLDDSTLLRSIANIIKEAGGSVPDYMLKLKKPSKRSRQQLAARAPQRDQISTETLYDKERKNKKRKIIEKSKKIKKAKKDLSVKAVS